MFASMQIYTLNLCEFVFICAWMISVQENDILANCFATTADRH